MSDAQAAALARLAANLQGTIEMLLAENGGLRAQLAELLPTPPDAPGQAPVGR